MSLGVISEIESEIAELAAKHGAAVVGIGRGWRFGSGTVIGRDRVLTAAHHVRPEGVTVRFAEERSATAELVGVDRDLGLALLEVDTGEIEPPGLGAGGRRGRDRHRRGGPRQSRRARPAGQPRLRGRGGAQLPRPARQAGLGGDRAHRDAAARLGRRAFARRPTVRLLGINALRLEGGLIVALGPASGLREAAERLGRGEEPARPFLGVAVAPADVSRRMRRAVGLPERDGLLVRGSRTRARRLRPGSRRVT